MANRSSYSVCVRISVLWLNTQIDWVRFWGEDLPQKAATKLLSIRWVQIRPRKERRPTAGGCWTYFWLAVTYLQFLIQVFFLATVGHHSSCWALYHLQWIISIKLTQHETALNTQQAKTALERRYLNLLILLHLTNSRHFTTSLFVLNQLIIYFQIWSQLQTN